MNKTTRSRAGARMLALLFLLPLLLGACGEIPRPFARDASAKLPNDFLLVREAAGIYVEPVEGPVPWVGKAVASAVSKALVEHQVVASDDASNRNSFVLRSQGYQQLHNGRPAELVMNWVLTDPQGNVIGETTSTSLPPPAFWKTPEPKHFKEIAEQTAPGIAAWLLPRTRRGPAANTSPVFVELIDGNGGKGNAILRQTLLMKLRGRGMEIAEPGAIPEDALTIAGEIEIKPIDSKRDRIAISWHLLDPQAREIGVVNQANAVPAGSMSESWLNAAPEITEGALDGLIPLLLAYERQRIGGIPVTKRQ